MNTFNDISVIDKPSTIPVAEIRNQLSESIKQLSPERLKGFVSIQVRMGIREMEEGSIKA